ncbi:MAG: hypothetical protein A3F11_00195 [Gammaproteobacteria bacterium RIFCSPHIGHO2_12_FULL_37_14]|nr:MAG: hypothetical protein A3F11_00195 [Gammaproteobacteria bacterium RIFCSPHIGHO2_12_FULL_37_14]
MKCEKKTKKIRPSFFNLRKRDQDALSEVIQKINNNEWNTPTFSLKKYKLSTPEMIQLIDALDKSQMITHLVIEGFAFNQTAATLLANWLGQQNKLKFIECSIYGVDTRIPQIIINELVKKPHLELEIFTVSQNHVGDECAIALAQWLKTNNTLKILALCWRAGITDSGAIALANALEKNSSLEEIHLFSNKEISDASIAQFSKLLSVNHFLKKVDLSYCADALTETTQTLLTNQNDSRLLFGTPSKRCGIR